MFAQAEKNAAVSHAKSAANHAKKAANETAAEMQGDLRDIANTAGRSVRQFVTTARDEAEHAAEVVSEQIKARPIQSSVVALGVGVVLGLLFRR